MWVKRRMQKNTTIILCFNRLQSNYILIQVNRIAKYSADVGKVWGKYLYLQQSKIQPASL